MVKAKASEHQSRIKFGFELGLFGFATLDIGLKLGLNWV
jgi:hypothetical protein